MHLFFTPDINDNATDYTLNEDESKHCIRVLRLQKGDEIVLIDGRGGKYKAIIEEDNSKRCKVAVVSVDRTKQRASFVLHMAIAPTKSNDRLEWFVEKATEIGIDEISLIQCEHSERNTTKTERIERVAVSAIKQSLNGFLPQINDLAGFEQLLKHTANFTGQKFIAHCNETLSEKKHLKDVYSKGNNVLILIGPEGDFSITEVQQALNAGFQEIALGSSRLRTETAALYAVTTVNIVNE